MITLALLMTIHYIADFLLQTDYQALGKAKHWKPLLSHTSIYSLCFVLFGFKFMFLTFILHTITDYLTSRWGGRNFFFRLDAIDGCDPPMKMEWQYVKENRGKFFNIIGFDQLVHLWCLVITYYIVNRSF